jgi:hypothetical protein
MALRLGELSVFLTADSTALARELKAAREKVKAAGQKASEYAPLIGAAMATGIGAGLLGGLDLEAARAKLAAQVGDPHLAEQLGKVAGDVYARGFADSAEAAMDAVRSVMQAGLVPEGDAAALEDLTVKAQAFADTWDIEVSEAVANASTLIKSGLAKDATNALDLLTVASRKVPGAMVGDLQEVSAEYAQFFARLGFSGEQAFALLVAGADKGKWGIDKVGDAIKEFSILATELEGPPAEALKTLGLNARQMQNDLLAGGNTARAAFEQVISALLSVKDPATQAQLAMDLFGTPLEDLSKADIPEFLASLSNVGDGLGNVAGASAAAGEALEQTNKQKLEAFKRQIQQALIEKVGQAVPYLERMGKWALDNAGTLLALGGTILGVAAAVYTVRGAIAAWNTATLVWTGITKAATAAQWLWNAAMAANPIGLIVLAIAALAAGFVLLWKNSETFRSIVTTAFGAVWSTIKWVWDWIVGNWPLLLAIITGPIGMAVYAIIRNWDTIKAATTAVKDWIVGAWNSVVDFVKSLPGKITNAARGMWDGIKNAFRSAVNWIISRWNNLSLTIGGGSIMGIDIPSVTLSTPNIPYLATGGHILQPGLAVVGEAGPELVHLGRGATVQPLTGGAAGGHAEAMTLRLVIQTEDGRVIKDKLIRAAADRGQTVAQYLSIPTP